MKMLRKAWLILRSLRQRRSVKQDIDEELRFHMEKRADDNIAAGMSPAEAARDAQRRFGQVQSIREECREARGANFAEGMSRDVRFSLRTLAKSPGFTLVAVLTLGLGIGAATSIFSVVNGVLIEPLPYQHADQLVNVWEHEGFDVGPGVFLDWKDNSHSFEGLSVVNDTELNLKGDGAPERLTGWSVSANFLNLIRVQPALGRGFLPDEDQPGGDKRVLILTHAVWKHQFDGDTKVIGRVVRLNTESYTIVGVLPPRAISRRTSNSSFRT
jgi:hypothetical protein